MVLNKHFSKNKTGMTYYDALLHKKRYARKKRIDIRIRYMKPKDFLEKVYMVQKRWSLIKDLPFYNSFDSYLNDVINKELANKYKKAMKNGEEFPMPVIDYITDTEEGRHRAYAAMKLGDELIPVVIVDKIEYVNIT